MNDKTQFDIFEVDVKESGGRTVCVTVPVGPRDGEPDPQRARRLAVQTLLRTGLNLTDRDVLDVRLIDLEALGRTILDQLGLPTTGDPIADVETVVPEILDLREIA